MKTTYTYQIYVYYDAKLHLIKTTTSFYEAKTFAFDYNKTYRMIYVVRVPDRQWLSMNYVPRCWTINGISEPQFEQVPILDLLTWI